MSGCILTFEHYFEDFLSKNDVDIIMEEILRRSCH